jgi:hypothetical protein
MNIAPLPQNFVAEASRIKSTRAPVQERAEPRHEERRRFGRPQGQRGRFASAVKPVGNGGGRRAARG